jgi:ABC-type transport system involved in multi-copper enzyme maturation permease subunit
MTTLVRVELLKLRTTPALYAVAGTVAVLTIAAAVTNVLVAGAPGTPAPGSPENVAKVLSVGSATSVAMLVLGILISAGEDRHRTILGAYLAEPRRARVLLAKLLTGGLVGAVGGALFFGLTLAVAVPLLASRGVHHLAVDVPGLALGTVLITCCFGLLGVALGALTRNTVAAVVGALVWVGVVELAVLQPLVPAMAKWLPTGAGVSLTTLDPERSSLLPPAAAAAVLVGWAALVALAATRITLGREVR